MAAPIYSDSTCEPDPHAVRLDSVLGPLISKGVMVVLEFDRSAEFAALVQSIRMARVAQPRGELKTGSWRLWIWTPAVLQNVAILVRKTWLGVGAAISSGVFRRRWPWLLTHSLQRKRSNG